MKKFYSTMMLISFICLAADSNSISTFIIWHAVWLAIMLICMNQIRKVG